jgi:hypothetical protein
MTPELQQYYERRLSMMGDEAWKDLIEDVERMIEATNRLDGIDSVESLWFRKGEVSIMKWILSLKEISEQAYQEMKDDDANIA